jgi:acylpyruvate hydrolase
MRFFVFDTDSRRGLAVADKAGNFRGLFVDDPRFPGDLSALVEGGAAELARAHAVLLQGEPISPADVTALPPFPDSQKIICVGLNYVDHSQEAGFKPPDYPTLFARFASSLVGHDRPIVRPRSSEQLDYEGELVAVIGRGGRHISKDAALDHVAGYSIFNDGSIRDYQVKSPQWTIGKNFDATGAFGPFFVTADELPAGAKGLTLETRLNGDVVQRASTDDLIFDVATLVSTISEAITLAPGDVIVTGTPAGIGWARSPQLFMKAGDVCEVEIDGLGILRNTIIDETTRKAAK